MTLLGPEKKVQVAIYLFFLKQRSGGIIQYSPMVAMSSLSNPSNACQSPLACMVARSSAYTYFLKSEDSGWQVRDVNVEEKGCQKESLWDAVFEAL